MKATALVLTVGLAFSSLNIVHASPHPLPNHNNTVSIEILSENEEERSRPEILQGKDIAAIAIAGVGSLVLLYGVKRFVQAKQYLLFTSIGFYLLANAFISYCSKELGIEDLNSRQLTGLAMTLFAVPLAGGAIYSYSQIPNPEHMALLVNSGEGVTQAEMQQRAGKLQFRVLVCGFSSLGFLMLGLPLLCIP